MPYRVRVVLLVACVITATAMSFSGVSGSMSLLQPVAQGNSSPSPGTPAPTTTPSPTSGTPVLPTTPSTTGTPTTPTPKPNFRLFLPLTLREDLSISVGTLFTSAGGGTERYAFVPGEALTYHAAGLNVSGKNMKVELAWSLEGPCGSGELFRGGFSIEGEGWVYELDKKAPNCPGVYTHTLQVRYSKGTAMHQSRYVVINPSQVLASDRPAFDKCNVSSPDAMKVWWDKSPYYIANIYIGGIARGCANEELDPFWVYEVKNQGWAFIPTWVGPQAPCSKFRYKMSSDPNQAYQQGREEANQAHQAAASLGLLGQRGIYYDLESFSGASDSCIRAVQSFIRGWTERLHELGAKSGVYGSSCTSYLSKFAESNPVPDDVWIAYWNLKTFNEKASVYGVPCIGDSLWKGHRIRQYTGGHVETYGGVTMSIDSNATDGYVTSLPHDTYLTQQSLSTSPAPFELEDMELVDDRQGWVLSEGRLLWSEDGGESWVEAGPRLEANERLLAAEFLNASTGWALVQDDPLEMPALRYTLGDRFTWSEAALPEVELPAPVRAASLEFIDPESGWLVLQLESGVNFSLGVLLATTDGGRTWEQRDIPIAEPVHFTDPLNGWVKGGPRDEVYTTQDGGRSWELETAPEALAEALAAATGPVQQNLPQGAVDVEQGPGGVAWAWVREVDCQGTKTPAEMDLPATGEEFQCTVVSKLVSSADQGQTWQEITPR